MNERAGQELSAEARRLITDAQGVDDPTAEDEARVKARWLAGIAAGAGVGSLSEAVRAAASSGWSWGIKAAAMAGAAAVASVAVYLGWPEASPSAPIVGAPRTAVPELPAAEAPVAEAPADRVTEAPVAPALPSLAEPTSAPSAGIAPTAGIPVQAPIVAAPELVVAPELEEPKVIAPTVRAVRARTVAAQKRPAAAQKLTPAQAPVSAREPAAAAPVEEAPAAAASGQLGEEIARISEIREHLQTGSPARALELLTEYRHHFAQPNLAMEADALQVDALCKAGQREAARKAAAAFVSRWPGSPLEQRVSGACR